MIAATYKLKNGADELEVDRSYANQFFKNTSNVRNDGYKLKDFLVENNEGLATMVRFLNPILTPDQLSLVHIEVATMVITVYLGL